MKEFSLQLIKSNNQVVICDSPRQPSGPFPRPWCPCLQWSQRSPSTLALHRHWPEIIPAATSVRASHSPPCRDPSGSQLQAARRQCTRPAQGRFTHTRKLAHCVESRKRSHDYCQEVLGTCRRTLGAEGCTQKVTVPPLTHLSKFHKPSGQGALNTRSSSPPTPRIFTRENGQDNERKRAAAPACNFKDEP